MGISVSIFIDRLIRYWSNIPSFFFWNNTLSWFAADVIGDFTIELKKTKGQDELMVRAARSKLNATKKNVSLQGMDEEGPVKSILSNGRLWNDQYLRYLKIYFYIIRRLNFLIELNEKNRVNGEMYKKLRRCSINDNKASSTLCKNLFHLSMLLRHETGILPQLWD